MRGETRDASPQVFPLHNLIFLIMKCRETKASIRTHISEILRVGFGQCMKLRVVSEVCVVGSVGSK